ncbi:venom carboxylesterase-6-like [Rhodnius prolixus]|uniref:Carboxylic ester hydrolase n=1 Tax=Rhodnius prolixus TaxID=13249 RepID=A0A905QWI6_RHOPR
MDMVDVTFIITLLGLFTWSSSQPTAQIGQGALNGLYLKTVNNRPFAAFLGIPYAKPPVGKHRFKESVPASPWLGVYNATSFPDDCLQYSHVKYTTEDAVYGSEDCLYVNVFTPKISPGTVGTSLLDVVIYIHGGAFMFYSSLPYRPEYLLDKDVILVTFNYRLGALGFLSTEDNVLPGNNGLKDQVLALKWVKNNIAAFGGNPNSITICGLSAGGASVHYHMLSPLSQGLFNKAIAASGSALCPWAQMENAREKTLKLAAYLGCPVNESHLLLKCLRDRPASRIVWATKLFMPWLYNPFSPFSAVVEPPGPSAFIAERPIDIILQKKAKDVPFLVSLSLDEGLYPGAEILAKPEAQNDLDNKWNEYLPFLLDYNYTAPIGQLDPVSNKIREFYLGSAKVTDAKQKFIKMIGDRLFYVDVIKTSKLHAEHYTSPVYSYIFTHKGSKRFGNLFGATNEHYDGVGHGTDIAYVIRATYLPIETDPTDMILTRRMIDYWLTFIKGAPMPKGWPTVKQNLPDYGFLEIQNANEANDVVKIESDYGNEEFWNSLKFNENVPVIVRPKIEL